jgi:soluble lytic murein transglycosylase-like protein
MPAATLEAHPVHLCVLKAADKYALSPSLIYAILRKEGGKAGSASYNKSSKTYDLGATQINSSWLPTLAKYGITPKAVQWDNCTNIEIGAWILRTNYNQTQDWTKAIMAYNVGLNGIKSKPTAAYKYAKDVILFWHDYHKYFGK